MKKIYIWNGKALFGLVSMCKIQRSDVSESVCIAVFHIFCIIFFFPVLSGSIEGMARCSHTQRAHHMYSQLIQYNNDVFHRSAPNLIRPLRCDVPFEKIVFFLSLSKRKYEINP